MPHRPTHRRSTLYAVLIAVLLTSSCDRIPDVPASGVPMPSIESSPILRLAAVGEPVRRDDLDGDNWPTTWTRDGTHLMAYGDGWGVRSMESAPKLNSGLVRVLGTPRDLRATEVPIPYFGRGAENPNFKGCGILEAQGIVYHFLRYQAPAVDGARTQIASKLIWSSDDGATWKNAEYGPDAEAFAMFFREPDHAFHSPTFLQAGRGYVDALDGYVYLYSPHEDQRRGNDNLDLARVPVGAIADRAAYEFFGGLGQNGDPLWTRVIANRRPVLNLPGHVSPGDAVWLPAMRRVLLATVSGSWSSPSRLVLLDAPQPWGPWTLVGTIEPWGTGQNGDHRYDPRIPAGWIRPDGMSFHLVYSDRIASDKMNLQEIRLEQVSSPPAFDWGTATPEEAGFHAERLEILVDALMADKTRALLIARGDRIVTERYADGFGPTNKFGTASLAKSLVAGLSLLVLLQDGRLALDDPASRWIDSWRSDPLRAKITVRHLATHSSGIENAEQAGLPHSQLPGWKGEFWKRSRPRWQFWRTTPNPFQIARDSAPVLFEPGSSYAYSNPGVAALAVVAGEALRNASERDVESLLRERVMRPVGIPDEEWSISYEKSWELDRVKLQANWGGARFTARATARLGRLMLRRGDWEGRSVLNATWVDTAVADPGTPRPDRARDSSAPMSGILWWTNRDRVWPSLPEDAFVGAGAGHQVLLVVPSLDLVAVRFGRESLGGSDDTAGYWESLETEFFRPLSDALVEQGSM